MEQKQENLGNLVSHEPIVYSGTDDQVVRICPLCGSVVRLFFVNFSEKVLMCENSDCDFPFGYERLQMVSDIGELRPINDSGSSFSFESPTGTSSLISTAAWSDIDKLNKIYESEDTSDGTFETCKNKQIKSRKEIQKNEEEIKKTLESIRELNSEWSQLKNEEESSINNENWLKNLMILQGMSGKQLLKENEIMKLKKNEPSLGSGELKININANEDQISAIDIQFCNEHKTNDNKIASAKNNETTAENNNQVDTIKKVKANEIILTGTHSKESKCLLVKKEPQIQTAEGFGTKTEHSDKGIKIIESIIISKPKVVKDEVPLNNKVKVENTIERFIDSSEEVPEPSHDSNKEVNDYNNESQCKLQSPKSTYLTEPSNNGEIIIIIDDDTKTESYEIYNDTDLIIVDSNKINEMDIVNDIPMDDSYESTDKDNGDTNMMEIVTKYGQIQFEESLEHENAMECDTEMENATCDKDIKCDISITDKREKTCEKLINEKEIQHKIDGDIKRDSCADKKYEQLIDKQDTKCDKLKVEKDIKCDKLVSITETKCEELVAGGNVNCDKLIDERKTSGAKLEDEIKTEKAKSTRTRNKIVIEQPVRSSPRLKNTVSNECNDTVTTNNTEKIKPVRTTSLTLNKNLKGLKTYSRVKARDKCDVTS